MELEKYIWSLDISTTNLGSSLWNNKGKLIELKHLELKINKNIPPEDRIIHKAEIFKKYCVEYKERILQELNGDIINIIVEEPLQNTPVNINTTALLLGFNGIATYILYEVFSIIPIKISVYESRKLFLPEIVYISHKKNKKTSVVEIKETLSFPPKYKNDKKRYIWEKVAKLEPQIEWVYKKDSKEPKDICYDLSDSYACGHAYFKKIGILK